MGFVHDCLSLHRTGREEEAKALYNVFITLKELNSKIQEKPYFRV